MDILQGKFDMGKVFIWWGIFDTGESGSSIRVMNISWGKLCELDFKIEKKWVITDHIQSIKNATEIAGMKEANIRSAICHCKLLKWAEDKAGTGVTECDAVDELYGYYTQMKDFR